MTTIYLPQEKEKDMSQTESLQKRIIELQDAELVRLRLEVNQLKFELSRLQAAIPTQDAELVRLRLEVSQLRSELGKTQLEKSNHSVFVPNVTIVPRDTWPNTTWSTQFTEWTPTSETHPKTEQK